MSAAEQEGKHLRQAVAAAETAAADAQGLNKQLRETVSGLKAELREAESLLRRADRARYVAPRRPWPLPPGSAIDM